MLNGRTKIITSKEIKSAKDVIDIIKFAYPLHANNVKDMQTLIDYQKGKHKIENKVNPNREEINNKITVNNASMITRKLGSYFLSDGISFVSRSTDKDIQQDIDILNALANDINKPYTDMETYNNSAICGISYQQFTREKNDSGFSIHALSPLTTFEVLSSKIGNPVLLACTYFLSENNGKKYITINAYDKQFKYQMKMKVDNFISNSMLKELEYKNIIPFKIDKQKVDRIPHLYSNIPIVSYYSNLQLVGKFENVIDIIDAINKLESGSLDDIEQTIQSILLIFGVDSETAQELTTNGLQGNNLIAFPHSTDSVSKQDAKILNAQLNPTSTKDLRDALDSKMREIVGIPDRKTRGGGGGDTMGAVKLRDGWADLEEVAKGDELIWNKSQRKLLSLILSHLHEEKRLTSNVTTKDINIKFSRNKNDDLYVKATTGKLLFDMGIPLRQIALVMNLSNDSTEFATLWGENINRLKEEKKNGEYFNDNNGNKDKSKSKL